MIISKEVCLSEIRKMHETHGKVTASLINKNPKVTVHSIVANFGSLVKAYEEAGLNLKQGQRKMVSKDEIIIEINRLVEEHGYISKPIMEKYSSYSPKIVQRIFKNFSNMYEELGLERHSSGRIPTDKELFDECERIFKEHEFLSYEIIKKYSVISTTCFRDRARVKGWNGINYYREKVGCKMPKLGWNESISSKYNIGKFSKYLNEKPEKEKSFDWLRNPKNNYKLRIDAYYPKSNIAVEYNGPQHYQVDTKYTISEKELKRKKEIDKIKSQKIKEHGIHLIVIHFEDKVDDEYIKSALQRE